jgi:hypothetical protein
LLRYLHVAVDRSGYYDPASGKSLPGYDPATDPKKSIVVSGGGGFGGAFTSSGMVGGITGYTSPTVIFRQLPPQESFTLIGHAWWALLLGFAGGQFALWVYTRRTRPDGS